MSNAYNNVVAALNADAELRDKVMAASSAEERAALLTAAGLELPTAEEVEAAKLAGLSGGAKAQSTGITYCVVSIPVTAATCSA